PTNGAPDQIHVGSAASGGVWKIEVAECEEVRQRPRTRKLLRRFRNVLHRQRVDCDSLDVDREELALASAAGDLEEARLFEVPDLPHECAVQRRSAGSAASGESFSSVHDVPIGIASAKRAWPIL